MNFSEKLASVVQKKESCLMLGLDPNLSKMPKEFQALINQAIENGTPKNVAQAQACFDFCREILEFTERYICGVKIQMAYFEVFGAPGIVVVEALIKLCKERGLVVLVDGKRNDIGTTCEAYSEAYLGDGPLGADSLTVSPFLGSDGIIPFTKLCEANDRGIFVLVKTSNPSAHEFQDAITDKLAEKVEEWGASTRAKNGFSSVGAVVGATNTEELMSFREKMPHTWLLAPGVGAQGGDMAKVLETRKNGLGVIIPVSRGILYASGEDDFAEKAGEVARELWEAQKTTN